MAKKKFNEFEDTEEFIVKDPVPEGAGVPEEVLGVKVNRSDLRCGSCTNPVTGTNSLNHPNYHVVEIDDKTAILCSDCDRKVKANPLITPAFYVTEQEGKLIENRWA